MRNFIYFALLIIIVFDMACTTKSKRKIEDKPFGQKNDNTFGLEHDSVETSGSRLVEIGPTRNFEPDHFIDKTVDYGLEGVKASHIYAVDFDNDGFTDLVTLEDHYSIPVFYRFIKRDKKFKKIKYNPFKKVERASFLVFVDLNKDKVLDLLVATLNQGSALRAYPLMVYKGVISKGRISYKLMPKAFPSNKTFPIASLTLLDYDLDGNLDIFQGNWFRTEKKRKIAEPDRLYKGNGFKFVDVSYLLEYEHKYNKKLKKYPNSTPTFGSSSCDIDQNGYPDILTANSGGFGNKLWMNLFDFKHNDRILKDYGKDSGFAHDNIGRFQRLGGGNSFYNICFDYNNDGIMDIITGELNHPYDQDSRDRSSILTGKELSFPVKFIRSEFLMSGDNANWSYGNRQALFLDYNNDGRTDIIIDNSGFPPNSRLILFEQETNHSYTDVAENLGVNILNPSGTVKLDINNDGLVDFISGQTNIRKSSLTGRLYLFENITKRNNRRSIRFFLRGEHSNSSALGAMVILKTNKNTYRHWVEYSSGAQSSQNENGVHFGIGSDLLEYVEVRWPIVMKNLKGKRTPVFKRYDLSKFKYNAHFDVTLCESGRYMGGKGSCRPDQE